MSLRLCRAAFATPGNQLISEAIPCGKLLLRMPGGSLQQRLNARYVRRLRNCTTTRRGDEAFDQLRRDWPVVRIPTMRYCAGPDGRRLVGRTLRRLIPAVLDLLLEGPIFQLVRDEIACFAPRVVISDSEAWTHRAARSLRIPRISFDHYGVMAFCRLEMPPLDRLAAWGESLLYRALVCRPQRVIATAFYDGPVLRPGACVVGPVLRAEVRAARPSRGEHLLVYFSNAAANFTPRVERALRELDCPVKVYHPTRRGREGNVEFRPIAVQPFIDDLAACRAAFATAGNQLISEAIHFGKPLLLPEDSLEQRLNARYVRLWGIGMAARRGDVTAGLLRRFLDGAGALAANIPARRRDGQAEAVAAIERAIEELAGR